MVAMENAKPHSITLNNRSEISITGVIDVKAFDDLEVMLETEMGGLLIKGKNLVVKSLSVETGRILVEGLIDGLIYTKTTAPKSKESLVKRLFS